jgi:transcriptional regulator of acetoin/glycerol metabolism
MELRQREHINAVMAPADEGRSISPALTPDPIIRASWTRCVHKHGLDPTRMQEAVIVPMHQLREHREPLEQFLHIARHGFETLCQQVAGMGYCVLRTDARGVTVDFIGDLQIDASLRKAGRG